MRVLRWRKKAVLALAACVTTVCCIASWLTADLSCSPAESQQLLDQLCEDYHAGLIDGSLCPEICDKQTITFLKCTNYKDGKKILIAKWKQETIVLKAKKGHWTNFEPIEVSGIFPSMKDFLNMVRDSVEFTLGIRGENFPEFAGDGRMLLSKVWSMETKRFFSTVPPSGDAAYETRKTNAMIRSLWTLISQTEYVMMTFLRDKPHIPRLYGTCGHFYAMEYLPSRGVLESTLLEMTGLREEMPWKDRLKVTLSLLEALKSYDEEFHETLHICDVKTENFGISSKGTVKLIDMDTAFFTSRMRRELSSDVCTRHSDCDFFDCEGWCDLSTGRCTEHRINNNLQVVCKKLLSSQMSNKYQSLLRGAPYDLEEQLAGLVAECVEGGAPGGVSVDPVSQHHAPVRLFDRIYNLLQKDLVHNAHT